MESTHLIARANHPAVRLVRKKKTVSNNCRLENYAQRWIRRAGIYLAPDTLYGYKSILKNHIIPAFGTRHFRSLTRDEVAEFTIGLFNRGLGTRRVVDIIAVLRRMYYDAMEHGEVLYNPAAGALRGLHKRHYRATIEPLGRDEARCLIIAARRYEPHWYPLFLCALTTGMRKGELIALRPCDIDFELGFINVRYSDSGGGLRPTKNHKVRRIDMNERLSEVLSRFLKWRIAVAFELEREMPRNERRTKEKVLTEVMEKPLFTTLYCCRLYPQSINKAFRRTLKKAGLRRVRFHDLRHTFATLLIKQGESLPYVRDQLGHSSIEVTVDFYGHLTAGSNKAAVDRLVGFIDDTSIQPVEPQNPFTTAPPTRKSDYLRAWT